MCKKCEWSSNAETKYVCPFNRCVKRNEWISIKMRSVNHVKQDKEISNENLNARYATRDTQSSRKTYIVEVLGE